MTGVPSYPVTEQEFLEDNIATVAFHLGQPGARLSVSHDGPGLIVEPGEVLKEISRRLSGVAQAPLMQQLQYVIEGIILRRIYEKRIEGYTIEMAKEIAEALAVSSTHQLSPTPEEIAHAETLRGQDLYAWPIGCHSPNSCRRNGRCMYIGCKYDGTTVMSSTTRGPAA